MQRKLLLTSSACALGLASAGANAVQCFLVPLPGAKARAVEGEVVGPALTSDCAQLQVSEGSVRVVYTDRNGDSHTPLVKANERFSAPDAADAIALKAVDDQMRPRAASTNGGMWTKGFDPPSADAITYALPFSTVYLPPDGLTFRLGAAAGASPSFTIAGSDGKPVASGSASGGMVMLRGGTLKPDVNYQFVLNIPGKVVASKFRIAGAVESGEVESSLRKIGAEARNDPRVYAIARGLVFEQNSMAFNRMAVIKEITP